jgi:hypothetical protein
MLLDGVRAMVVGDYFRPQKGPYAGQLGPWARLVAIVGIDPESRLMHLIFVGYGLLGLSVAALFYVNPDVFSPYLILLSFMSLWYLGPGTIMSILQIILLFWLASY